VGTLFCSVLKAPVLAPPLRLGPFRSIVKILFLVKDNLLIIRRFLAALTLNEVQLQRVLMV
jgi:hypothetical protein